MPSTATSRLGQAPGSGAKEPCREGSRGNTALPHTGLYTLNGYALQPGDRVLDTDNADTSLRGVWVADAGPWSRAPDWDQDDDVVSGVMVAIPDVVYQVQFTGDHVIGSSVYTFEVVLAQATIDAAAASAAAAEAARLLADADAAATAADRVQTGLDRIATAADRVQTGSDRIATAADRVATGSDVAATAADRVATTSDAATTTANRTAIEGILNYTPTRDPVRLATTAPLAAHTYDNAAGTITFSAVGSQTVDGVETALTNRLLVAAEGAATLVEQGDYTVTTKGVAGSVQEVWTRATDGDTGAELVGSVWAVTEGTLNTGARFRVSPGLTSITLGTTPVTLEQQPGTVAVESAARIAGDAAERAYLQTLLRYLSVAGGEYALQFGSLGGPVVAGVTAAQGLFDFLGVRKLPLKTTDGTLGAELGAHSNRSGWLWVICDRTTRAILAGIDSTGALVFNGALAEVVTARGTAASLDARLSRALTAAGSPKTPTENLSRLRNLRSGAAALKAGSSALVHVILDGDSWWDGKTYGSADAISRFYADSGLTDAGPGWIGFGSALAASFSPHGTARNNISVTRTGTWTDLFHSADAVPGTPQNYPGYDAVQSGADGSIYTISGSRIASCTSLTLFCGKGGTVEQSWDGVVYTPVTVASGSGSTTASISLVGQSTSLRLRCTNGTVIAGLFGLSASSGVVFSNLSSSGSTAAQHAAVQADTDYKAMMTALPGDTITALIQLGLNDNKAGVAAATVVTSIDTVAAGYRTAFDGLPSVDVAVLCQPNTAGNTYGQDVLSPLLRAWAEDNDAAFMDWQDYFGAIASSGDYASYSRDYTSGAASTATPLLQVSTTYRHPSLASDLVTAGKSPALSGEYVVSAGLSGLFLSTFRSN